MFHEAALKEFDEAVISAKNQGVTAQLLKEHIDKIYTEEEE